MPRNTIHQLAALAGRPSNRPDSLPEHALPADVQRLLAERRQLASRMGSLIGEPDRGADTVTDRRFPVTPLDERRRLDARWADHRDRVITAARSSVGDIVTRKLRDLVEPATRSGQRAINGPRERSGQRRYLGFELDELRPRLPNVVEPPVPTADLTLDRLRSNPRLTEPEMKEFGRALRTFPDPKIRSLSDRMQRVERRLDLWHGGSGDLNRLRTLALERLRDRRREQRDDAARDAFRLDRIHSHHEDPFARRDRRRGW